MQLLADAAGLASDLDREDLLRGGLDLPSEPGGSTKPPRSLPNGLDAVAAATAAFIDLSLSRTRNRALARYHCRLESITQPDLRALLAPHEEAAFRQTRELLAGYQVPDLDARARAFVAAVAGLIVERLVNGSRQEPGSAENRAEPTAAVRALLSGATAR